MRRHDADAAGGPQRRRVVADDREVVPRHAQLGPAQREHLGDDAELEQAEAVADRGRRRAGWRDRERGGRAWQNLNANLSFLPLDAGHAARGTLTRMRQTSATPSARSTPTVPFTAADRGRRPQVLAEAPARLRLACAGLDDGQLDTPYRPGGWTVRQVVHHVVDSHVNAYLRTEVRVERRRHRPSSRIPRRSGPR